MIKNEKVESKFCFNLTDSEGLIFYTRCHVAFLQSLKHLYCRTQRQSFTFHQSIWFKRTDTHAPKETKQICFEKVLLSKDKFKLEKNANFFSLEIVYFGRHRLFTTSMVWKDSLDFCADENQVSEKSSSTVSTSFYQLP